MSLPCCVCVCGQQAEAERQLVDCQFRSIKEAALRTAQEGEVEFKVCVCVCGRVDARCALQARAFPLGPRIE